MFFKTAIESVTVEINAPISKVWEVLVDLDSYAEWNPYTVRIDADLNTLGSPVDLHVQMTAKNLIVQTEELRVNKKEEQLSWGMKMLHPWLMCAQRDQIIKAVGENKTTYYTVDVFEGLLVPLCMLLYGKPIKQGFDAIAHALKQRVESL